MTERAGATQTALRSLLPVPLVDGFRERWLIPVLIRIAMMAANVVLVALLPRTGTASSRFSTWDARIYAAIATNGYDQPLVLGPHAKLPPGSAYAFFPLYPELTRLLAQATSLTPGRAASLLAITAAITLGPLAYAVTRAAGGERRAAYLAVVLLGLLPMAITFQMGYAESLFTALAFAAFLAAQRNRWGTATLFLVLAGFTRPVGYVVAVAILVLGLQAWRRARTPLLPVLGCVAAGLAAAPVLWAYTGWQLGSWTAWFEIQRTGWGTSIDWGATTWTFLHAVVTDLPSFGGAAALPAALTLFGYAAVSLACCTSPRWWPYAASGLLALVTIGLTSNFWHSKPRLLLVASLLVVPVAIWLSRKPIEVVAPLLVFVGLLSVWFGGYMLTGWPFAI